MTNALAAATSDSDPASLLVDRQAITDFIHGWGRWRDSPDWQRLRDAFTSDATIRTTWFDGTASDLVEASMRMAESPTRVQHSFGMPVVWLNGDRAVSETRVELLIRSHLSETEVDVHCYGRFHDRLVRQCGRWRLLLRVPVHDKDRIMAVLPCTKLRLDHERLASFPAHYRFTAYLQSAGGATITPDLPAPNSQAYWAIEADSAAWLKEGASA